MNFIDPKLENYCVEKSNTYGDVCEDIAGYTKANVPMSQMLIGKLEASFLCFLIKSYGVKNILEIGTYTGYSALAMASALEDDGLVHSIDINPETTEVARSFWDKSPHGKKIHEHLGEAKNILPTLKTKFDLIFVDANKEGYREYLDLGLQYLSDQGIMVFDNCLWGGRVLDTNPEESSTKAIINLNDHLSNSSNLDACLIPIRDGLFLVKPIKS